MWKARSALGPGNTAAHFRRCCGCCRRSGLGRMRSFASGSPGFSRLACDLRVGSGPGTEFDQLREYVPDDEYRRIDWAATARAGRPIVRTFRAEQNQRVVCLLDNGRVMAGRVANVPRVEHAMDAVLTLARVSTGLGDKCGLVTFDQ